MIRRISEYVRRIRTAVHAHVRVHHVIRVALHVIHQRVRNRVLARARGVLPLLVRGVRHTHALPLETTYAYLLPLSASYASRHQFVIHRWRS